MKVFFIYSNDIHIMYFRRILFFNLFIFLIDINTETHFVFNGNSRAPSTNRHNGDHKTGNVTPDSRRLFSEEDYYRLLQSHWKKRINKQVCYD